MFASRWGLADQPTTSRGAHEVTRATTLFVILTSSEIPIGAIRMILCGLSSIQQLNPSNVGRFGCRRSRRRRRSRRSRRRGIDCLFVQVKVNVRQLQLICFCFVCRFWRLHKQQWQFQAQLYSQVCVVVVVGSVVGIGDGYRNWSEPAEQIEPF